MRSAVERVRNSLDRIEAVDTRLRSCLLVRREAALREAAAVDRQAVPGPLAGWTVGVKDNMDVAGTVRTDGIGPPHPPPAHADAEAVRRLRAAGAVIVAKTNLEELSFGATTQNPTWGACRNPWDDTRIPGGSSGGSAVAVAAGLVDVALGTDTGGSLRNPAAFCGISTIRPTHGLVPVAGTTPLSPSMDVVGPMARTVSELAHLLAVLSGRSRSSAQPLRGMRIGVPRSYFLDDLEAAVAAGFNALLDLLRDGGAALVTIELGNVGEVAEAMAVLQNTEAAGTLAPFADDARISAGIRERIQLGRSSTATEQHQAGVVAQRWRDTVTAAFEQVRLIATPATAFVAPAAAADNLVRLSRRINRNTGCWSLLGTPVLGIPTQPAPDGLPVGVQVIAPRGADALLLSFGRDVQRRSDWHLATRRIGGGA